MPRGKRVQPNHDAGMKSEDMKLEDHGLGNSVCNKYP